MSTRTLMCQNILPCSIETTSEEQLPRRIDILQISIITYGCSILALDPLPITITCGSIDNVTQIINYYYIFLILQLKWSGFVASTQIDEQSVVEV